MSNPEKNKYFKNVTLETSQTSTFFMKLEKDHIYEIISSMKIFFSKSRTL